jgi:hypothetical protein
MGEDRIDTRRKQDKGLQKYVGPMQLAISLVTAIGVGIVGWNTLDLTVRAHAGELKKIMTIQDSFRPRITSLEATQRELKTKLESMHEEQKSSRVRGAADRLEILNAIKDVGSRISTRTGR